MIFFLYMPCLSSKKKEDVRVLVAEKKKTVGIKESSEYAGALYHTKKVQFKTNATNV